MKTPFFLSKMLVMFFQKTWLKIDIRQVFLYIKIPVFTICHNMFKPNETWRIFSHE